MVKKGFNTTSKYLENCLTNLQKYINHGKRAMLNVAHDSSGVNATGTPELMKFYFNHKEEIDAAALADTKHLNDEQNDAPVAEIQTEGIIADYYRHSSLPKLDVPLSLMAENELVPLLYKVLKREIAVKCGKMVAKIRWGQEHHHVSSWPDDYAPWHLVSNPAHGQREKFAISFVEIMKIAIVRHFHSQGIDHNEYLKENVDQKLVTKKLKARGLTALPPIPFVITSEDVEVPASTAGSETVPTTSEPSPSPSSHTSSQSSPPPPSSNQSPSPTPPPPSPIQFNLSPPPPIMDVAMDSDAFNGVEEDDFGRILYPSKYSSTP